MAGLPSNETAYARPLPDGSGSAWNSLLGIFFGLFPFFTYYSLSYEERMQKGHPISLRLALRFADEIGFS
jgi:hypothetical protein